MKTLAMGDNADVFALSLKIGPCSMCNSKNACILRAPTTSSLASPVLWLVAKRLAAVCIDA
jgi:hypothetical protein